MSAGFGERAKAPFFVRQNTGLYEKVADAACEICRPGVCRACRSAKNHRRPAETFCKRPRPTRFSSKTLVPVGRQTSRRLATRQGTPVTTVDLTRRRPRKLFDGQPSFAAPSRTQYAQRCRHRSFLNARVGSSECDVRDPYRAVPSNAKPTAKCRTAVASACVSFVFRSEIAAVGLLIFYSVVIEGRRKNGLQIV